MYYQMYPEQTLNLKLLNSAGVQTSLHLGNGMATWVSRVLRLGFRNLGVRTANRCAPDRY